MMGYIENMYAKCMFKKYCTKKYSIKYSTKYCSAIVVKKHKIYA